MKKTHIFIVLGLISPSVYAAESTASFADAVTRQQQRDEALQKQLQPEPTVFTGLEQQLQTQSQFQYLKSHSEDVCFEVKKFVLIGDDARQFTFAMRPVIQGEHIYFTGKIYSTYRGWGTDFSVPQQAA